MSGQRETLGMSDEEREGFRGEVVAACERERELFVCPRERDDLKSIFKSCDGLVVLVLVVLAIAAIGFVSSLFPRPAPTPPPEPEFIEVGPRPARPAPTPTESPDRPRVR